MSEDAANETPETVSWNAHQRVKQERDQAKQELEQAKGALQDANLMFEAQGYLSGKVKDPVTAAKMVLPELRSFKDAEERLARLDEAIPLFAPLEQTATKPESDSSEQGEVVPDAPPTPSFMKPSPASDGPAPTEATLSMQSPEVKAMIAQGRDADVLKMIQEGKIRMHALNRTAQAHNAGR